MELSRSFCSHGQQHNLCLELGAQLSGKWAWPGILESWGQKGCPRRRSGTSLWLAVGFSRWQAPNTSLASGPGALCFHSEKSARSRQTSTKEKIPFIPHNYFKCFFPFWPPLALPSALSRLCQDLKAWSLSQENKQTNKQK